MKRLLKSILLCELAVVVCAPQGSFGQVPSKNDWAVLQSLPVGGKVDVKLKNGKTVHSEFASSTDYALTVFRNRETMELTRNDVVQVYRVFSKRVGKTTLIGAAVGAGVGAVVGAAGNNCNNASICIVPRSASIPLGAMVFGISGAGVGAVVGATHHNRQLVYDANGP